MFSPGSSRPNIFSRLNVAVRIDVKDGFLGLVLDFRQVILKTFDSLVERHIASVVSADDGFALEVCDEDSGSDHGLVVSKQRIKSGVVLDTTGTAPKTEARKI